MNNETERKKNIGVQIVENTNLIKWGGITGASVSMIDILANLETFSRDEQIRTLALAAVFTAIGAIGSVLDRKEKTERI